MTSYGLQLYLSDQQAELVTLYVRKAASNTYGELS